RRVGRIGGVSLFLKLRMNQFVVNHSEAMRNVIATPPTVGIGYFDMVIAHHREPFPRMRSSGAGARNAEYNARVWNGCVLIVFHHTTDHDRLIDLHRVFWWDLTNVILLGLRPTQILWHITIAKDL